MTDNDHEETRSGPVRRPVPAGVRARRDLPGSCCGYDPTINQVDVSPRARRLARIILGVVFLLAAALVLLLVLT